jgi:hypothetical protein
MTHRLHHTSSIQASSSDAMAVNSRLRTAQKTSWHFLLATDGVASRGIPAHQRQTAVGEVEGGGWRVVVAEKERCFVGWEVKERQIMICETEITNLMMDTKRNRW